MLLSALSPQSTAAYKRAWSHFSEFTNIYKLSDAIPISVPTIALFIAYLVSKSFASSTISSYLSAVGYVHKLNGFGDPADNFIIRKIITACHKQHPSIDSRLPITKLLLHKLVHALKFTTTSNFELVVYRAMFCMAFHAFLRIGEMTGQTENTIQLEQITLNANEFIIRFTNFKHSSGVPFHLTVKCQSEEQICAVHHIKNFIQLRGRTEGPLFAFPPAKAISRSAFNTNLRRAIIFCGLDPSRFKSHSFRIGACTEYVAAGASDSQIRQLGRWKSDAFKKYIRATYQVSQI